MRLIRPVVGAGVLALLLLVRSPIESSAAPAQGASFTLSGTLFNDHNGNGVRDGGDEGVECDPARPPEARTVPDDGNPIEGTIAADGNFTIDVPPGSFHVTASCIDPLPFDGPGRPPIVFAQQTLTPPSPVVVSDADVSGLDFGFFFQPLVVGQIFIDSNADGIRQGGEDGLDGCTVALMPQQSGETQTTTSASSTSRFTRGTRPGIFEFVLDPGSYQLVFECPQGYTPSTRDGTLVARSGENVGIEAVTCSPTPSPCIADGDAPRFGYVAESTTLVGDPGPPDNTLARTGARPNTGGLTTTAFALIAAGALLLLLAARRRLSLRR